MSDGDWTHPGGGSVDLSDRVGMAALAVRALLELTVVIAVGSWVLRVGPGGWRYPLAIGAVIALVVAWGGLVAPRAPGRLDDPWRLAIECVVFGLGTVALVGLGFPMLAVGYAIVAGLHLVVLSARGLR